MGKDQCDPAKGVLRFTASDPDTKCIVVDGVIDGLECNKPHTLQIHECGDISAGCESVGDMYGDKPLGTSVTDCAGRFVFRGITEQYSMADLIGRSVVVADAESKRYLLLDLIHISPKNSFIQLCPLTD